LDAPANRSTDATGSYRFERVEPREYKVRFDLASGVLMTNKTTASAAMTPKTFTQRGMPVIDPRSGSTSAPVPLVAWDGGLFIWISSPRSVVV
jgi:hypothetical protein